VTKPVTDEIARAVFGRMFETSTEALFLVDRHHGRIVSANLQVAELLAREPGEVVGMAFAQLAFEARDVSSAGQYEEVALRRGDHYPIFVTLSVVHVDDPTYGAFTAYAARDTTDRRLLERELVAKHTALTVAHAELDAACTQLRDTKSVLEARNREIALLAWRAAVGELVAGIAHHLNNPLGALASTTRHLQERIATLPADARAEIDRLIVRITKIARRIESNVNDIVKASRATTATQEADLPPELITVFATLSQRLDDIPTKDLP
jgi:signal transduction histidine kinase